MKPLSPASRRLLDLSQGQDDPDAPARDEVARSLATRIASGVGVAATGTAAAAAATPATAGLVSVIGKSVLVVCVTGVVATSGWVALRSSRPAPSAQAPRPGSAKVLLPAGPAEATPASAPSISQPDPDPSWPRKPTRSSPRTEPKAMAASPVSDRLREETEALRSAQQALRDQDARGALKLLDTQDARFRAGVLEQERAAARVLALCQAGSVAQARVQAESFARRWPRSALLARVRLACWNP